LISTTTIYNAKVITIISKVFKALARQDSEYQLQSLT